MFTFSNRREWSAECELATTAYVRSTTGATTSTQTDTNLEATQLRFRNLGCSFSHRKWRLTSAYAQQMRPRSVGLVSQPVLGEKATAAGEQSGATRK